MTEIKFNLGNFLKVLRSDKKETTRGLSKKIGYSHSYISSVENGSKLSPSSDFIQQYLLGLFDKNIGITNMYIEKIKYLSEGLYDFDTLPVNSEKDLIEASKKMKDEFLKFNNIHSFVTKKGENFFEEPINDLNFHLNELNNQKYYKGVEMSTEELHEIDKLINNYLITIYNTQLSQTSFLYFEGHLTKSEYEIYSSHYLNKLSKLDSETKGDLPDFMEEAKKFDNGDYNGEL